METSVDTISINGVEYMKKGKMQELAKDSNGFPYVIVRSYQAGVFAGYLEKRKDREVTLTNSRRLWYWDGSASLSQLAMEGTSKPENCKFPCTVDIMEILDVCEILYCTEKAKKSIKGVKIWQA